MWRKQVGLLLSVMLIVAAFLVTTVLLMIIDRIYFTPSGFDEVSPGTALEPVILSSFSLIGIVSKRLFDMVSEYKDEGVTRALREAFSPLGLIRSIVICPIVIISFYQSIKQISDFIFVALIAYQNGFFFETVLQSREKKVASEG